MRRFFYSKDENTVSSGPPFIATVRTDACHGAIRYLEHVQLNVTISYPVRGYLEIDLVSPSGNLITYFISYTKWQKVFECFPKKKRS